MGKSTIDLAAASHPDVEGNPIQPLPSIPIQVETKKNQKMLKKEVVAELCDVVTEFKSLGLLVSWPVQREGWCGASCGKVLRILDQVLSEGTMSRENVICLWNGRHWTSDEDEWGRVSVYSVPTNKTVHVASKEQYDEDGMVATAVAQDFLEHHWPDELIMSSSRSSYSTATEIVEQEKLYDLGSLSESWVQKRPAGLGKTLIRGRM